MSTKQCSIATWKELLQHQTVITFEKFVTIGANTIWYTTADDFGERGMVQYNYKSDKIIQIVKYPRNLRAVNQCCCSHNDAIYIINQYQSNIVSFTPSDQKFTKLINIPEEIGDHPSCIAIKNQIHIFNGETNTKHHIVSINTRSITTLNDPTTTACVHSPHLVTYNDRIIKFGGRDIQSRESLDTFFMSSIINENDLKSITWTEKPEYKLKQGLYNCGYVIYKNIIVTFGGKIEEHKFIDNIYALDLDKEYGWVEIKCIKCPLESQYRAVLDGDDRVHLYTRTNIYPNWKESIRKHYSMPIKEIIKDVEMLVMGYMRMYIFGKKIIDSGQYDISLNSIIIDFVGIID